MFRKQLFSGSALLVVAMLAMACGEASDRPEDCRASEFFNEGTGRCTACPVISPPECPEGCGWEVFEGDNGCKQARCEPECRTCDIGQRYSKQRGLCEPCPGVPDCQKLACDGELRVEGGYRGACPKPSKFTCGECSQPNDECAVGTEGGCVDPTDE